MLALLAAAALADTGLGDTAIPTSTTPWTTTTPESGGTYTIWTPGWSRTGYWSYWYWYWSYAYYDYYDYYWYYEDTSGGDDDDYSYGYDDPAYTDGKPPDEDRSGDTGGDKEITCGSCDGSGGASVGLGLALIVAAGTRRRR